MTEKVTENYKEQIDAHGLSEREVRRQLNIFKNGIPFSKIVGTASLGKGIEVFSKEQNHEYVKFFESKVDSLDLLKFVPASGAASRMFKFLHRFLESYKSEEKLESYLDHPENTDIRVFYNSMGKFAFSELAFTALKEKYVGWDDLAEGEKFRLFVDFLLNEKGLNFSQTPKGLIPFHKIGRDYITAFGEQLFEAAFYASSKGVAKLHFTVSEEHESKFRKRYDEIQSFIELQTGIKFEISYSFQKKQTDTIAVTLQNEPFIDDKGKLLFRPSGHGALLQNLNECDADIIFIKNIDNVVSKKYVDNLAFYKKVLAGRLLSLQQKIFPIVEELQKKNPSIKILEKATEFVSEQLNIPAVAHSKENLLKILDRPIRVCGVVENTGAPGGGPFLVKNGAGEISRQIVEISQIDINNPEQKAFVDSATHFNPVDLVCGVRNYKGKKFDLTKYADPEAGFISEKSYQGTPVKALELPGLWNGAMANWNTVFVEVPLITFNPVKTVNDLLNEVHQSE